MKNKNITPGPLRAPGPMSLGGPQAKRARNKTRVYLEKGKQNKMCVFVNM